MTDENILMNSMLIQILIIDEKTFNEWKTNQILPKEFYVRDNYEDKTESLIFKIKI